MSLQRIFSTFFAVALLLQSVALGQDVQLTGHSPRLLRVIQPPDRPRPAEQVGSQLGGESIYGSDRYVTQEEGEFNVPELRAPTTELEKIGLGIVPPAMQEADKAVPQALPEGPDREGMWGLTAYPWRAPNTFSNPRYFEDVMLERHGHERCPPLQPLISGARFYATFPLLPYLTTVRPPCDTEYTLGFYRPGSRAPALFQRPPYQRNALLMEAAAVTAASGL